MVPERPSDPGQSAEAASHPETDLKSIVVILSEVASCVRVFDNLADRFDEDGKGTAANSALTLKAHLLVGLPASIEPLLAHVASDIREEMKSTLAEFSSQAQRAIATNSVLKLSTLLIDRDTTDKNHLERLIDRLTARLPPESP